MTELTDSSLYNTYVLSKSESITNMSKEFRNYADCLKIPLHIYYLRRNLQGVQKLRRVFENPPAFILFKAESKTNMSKEFRSYAECLKILLLDENRDYQVKYLLVLLPLRGKGLWV